MNKCKIAREYCIGCGLCTTQKEVKLSEGNKGFKEITGILTEEQEAFIENVCPSVSYVCPDNDNHEIWGNVRGVFSAYAKNEKVRSTASSGGSLTSLCLYLLEHNLIDGVIQVSRDSENVYGTVCKISTTREDIISCCGSRYGISSPWINLNDIISDDKVYAAVGKPCDITALRNAQEKEQLFPNIHFLLSFFCAGLPSDDAQKRLLKELDCENGCVSLNYRGNGWPGKATAIDKDGKGHYLEYAQAWGGILGRDVHPFCRICMDGIGLSSDVVCADGWHIKDGEPDFSEHEGRNLIIARTEKGLSLLNAACENNYIEMEPWKDVDELKIIQRYQYLRRATMKVKIRALSLFFRKTPRYDKKTLKELSKYATSREKREIFIGTVKRIVRGKM